MGNGGAIKLKSGCHTGYPKRAFLEILGKHKIPVFDYPAEELKKALGNV